jgi:hypothetical protein
MGVVHGLGPTCHSKKLNFAFSNEMAMTKLWQLYDGFIVFAFVWPVRQWPRTVT